MTYRFIIAMFISILFLNCNRNGNTMLTGSSDATDNTDSILSIDEQNNDYFPKRELDGYVIEWDSFNDLGRDVRYSRYKFFDTGLKGYPKLTFIDVFEFNDTAISAGSDGEFSKVILNTPDKFDIMQLHGDITHNLSHRESLQKSLETIALSGNLPKARYEYETVIDEMKELQWVSHFKKEIIRAVLYLKNLDGYNIKFAFSTRIHTKTQAENVYGYYNTMDTGERLRKEESDSLSTEALKRLPPFLFRTWEEYAVPFYRYGYAPIY